MLVAMQRLCVIDRRRSPATRVYFWRTDMTLCPIAIVAGCEKCPAFKICPLKGVIGDQLRKEDAPLKSGKAKPKTKAK